MAFGLVNRTKMAFVNVVVFGINVVWVIIEEVTLNITKADPAHGMDVITVVDVPDSQILAKKLACDAGAALAS